MKICYIDESGHCGEKYDSNQPVEVLCGTITDLYRLFKTQRQHYEILQILTDIGLTISELKASEVYRGRKSWNGIDHQLRDHIINLILQWSVDRSCKFIVCPIDTNKFFSQKKSGCTFCSFFKYPWEAGAMNIVLAIQRNNKSIKNNKGKTIVIFDELKDHDQRFLSFFENDLAFTDGYTGYKPKPRSRIQPQRLDQIIDIPHFSKSHLSVLIQVADFAAYIVNRYLLLTCYGLSETYKGEQNKIETWYWTIGSNLITHTSIDAPGKDQLCCYFREIRPNGWTARECSNMC